MEKVLGVVLELMRNAMARITLFHRQVARCCAAQSFLTVGNESGCTTTICVVDGSPLIFQAVKKETEVLVPTFCDLATEPVKESQ